MQWTVQGCFWHCLWLFVYKISREPLNRLVPNSQERRVWSLAWTSLNVKVKVTRDKKQGFQPIFRESLNWYATNSHGKCAWSLSTACVRFMFGKTSLPSSLECIFWISDSTFWRINFEKGAWSKNVEITDIGKAKTVVMVGYRTSVTWRQKEEKQSE